MSADGHPEEESPADFDAALVDLRAAVRAAGGGQRELTLIAVAAARRAARPEYRGPALPALLRHATNRLRKGLAIETVLGDLRE